jgi:hypothetical protein
MTYEFLALFQDIGFSAIHIFLNEDPKGKVDHHFFSIFSLFIFVYSILFTEVNEASSALKGQVMI